MNDNKKKKVSDQMFLYQQVWNATAAFLRKFVNRLRGRGETVPNLTNIVD